MKLTTQESKNVECKKPINESPAFYPIKYLFSVLPGKNTIQYKDYYDTCKKSHTFTSGVKTKPTRGSTVNCAQNQNVLFKKTSYWKDM